MTCRKMSLTDAKLIQNGYNISNPETHGIPFDIVGFIAFPEAPMVGEDKAELFV